MLKDDDAQIRSVSSADIAYSSQSWSEFYWRWGVGYSGDIRAKNKIQAFRFPTKLTQNDFDENAESDGVSPNYRIHGWKIC